MIRTNQYIQSGLCAPNDKLDTLVRRFTRLEFTGEGYTWIWDMSPNADRNERFINHLRPKNWEVAT